MKKVYSKPDILFEDFSLSTNIAAGCEEIPLQNINECGFKWSKGVYIFTDSVSGCSHKVVDGDGEYNGLCYHNPSSTNNVFYS